MKKTGSIALGVSTSLLNSYSMVFFSKNPVFACILLMVSFFDPWSGFSGLVSILVSILAAYLIGLNRQNILSGFYGFNSLLVGLGIGGHFAPSPEFYLLLVFASLLTLFLTLLFEGVIGKYGLPFLTLSFLFSFWLVMLASRRYAGLSLSERGIFTYNEFYAWGGTILVGLHEWLINLDLPTGLSTYFKSLSAIFFQYHLFPGILIAIGLLFYSRIAFLLSLLGFYSAFIFYQLIGANLDDLNYSFIGFNFILTAIAVGGFFIISSRISFLWVILLTPIISILLSSSMELLSYFQLATYSFPFNFVVLIFLYMLKFREYGKQPELVVFQEFSPERNLYSQQNSKSRFLGNLYLPFSLPVLGEWTITQGHSGEHTHQGVWKHAWDLEIMDDEGKPFSGNGSQLSDYYCYNKPVVAPADGWVEDINDTVEDNPPHTFNLEQNWGNTLILRHTDGLYSKMSHLRKGSFKVEKGAFVRRGERLALCGNSGRSPLPHLHFQLQTTPYIGSATLDYPIGRYILRNENETILKSWEKPGKGDRISNIETNNCLGKAFHFIPGQLLTLTVTENNREPYTLEWQVEMDLYNYTYLHCRTSGAKAYFRNENDLHYFTWFTGRRNTPLYAFYLGAYKVAKGFSPGLVIRDEFPLFHMQQGILRILQDFAAPFYRFVHAEYQMEYHAMRDAIGQSDIELRSTYSERTAFSSRLLAEYHFQVNHDRLEQFSVVRKGRRVDIQFSTES